MSKWTSDLMVRFERRFSTGHALTDKQNFFRANGHYVSDRIEAIWEGYQAATLDQPQPEVGGVHADDEAVDVFAAEMKRKLAFARSKGRGGWQNDEPGMHQRLSDMLRAHVEKGDPRDVANFCMFLYMRGESIAPLLRQPEPADAVSDEDVNFILDAAGRGDFYRADVRAALESFAARHARGVPDVHAMVYRFLAWRLPSDFMPDCGISFTPLSNPAWTHDLWPTGTNLFHAGQVEQMIRHMLAAQPTKDADHE